MKTKKFFAILFTFLLLFTMMPYSVMAEGEKGSLTVAFSPDGNPAANTEFKIYKVAQAGALAFRITEPFKDSSVSFEGLDTEGWRAAAQTLAAYADIKNISPLASGKIENSGKYVFSDLEPALYLVVGSDYETATTIYQPEAFLVSVPSLDENNNQIYNVTAEPKYEEFNKSGENTITRRVLKAWKNDTKEVRPSEVSISLLKDGKVYETVMLNEENNWRYQWENLNRDFRWTIVENNVPQDYRSTVQLEGITFLVTNTYDEPEPPEYKTERTVVKKWENDSPASRPEEIKVVLVKDGAECSTAVLNEANGWKYTWTGLEKGNYSLKEIGEIENYTKEIVSNGTVFTLTNTYNEPEKKITRTVKKVWKNDSGKNRPEEVKVLILKDGTEYDTVELNEKNGWKYSWTTTDVNALWEVKESTVPENYTAATAYSGGVFTITNTYHEPKKPDNPVTPDKPSTPDKKLPQTGLLWWPVPILAILGVAALLIGRVRQRACGEANEEVK